MANNNTEEEEQCTCSIHFNILVEPVVLDCQHWFCKECLRRYVASKNGINPDCPECRTPIDLPPDGVEGLKVNFKMRQICDSLRKRRENQKRFCQKHPGETLTRFCCECLVPVCEDCEEEDHQSHKHRSIGNAWRVVGERIEAKFRTAKAALAVSDNDIHLSDKRKEHLINQEVLAASEISTVLETLYKHLEEHSDTLLTELKVQVRQDLQREEEYIQNKTECYETVKKLETHERHLRNLLSSGGHSITDADLDALDSLTTTFDPGQGNDPPPRHYTRKFHPSPYLPKLLAEGFGAILTEEEIEYLKAKERAETAEVGQHGVRGASGRHASANGSGPSSKPSASYNDDDDEMPTPTHLMIRSKSKIILPPKLAHPCDVEPYQNEQQFLVSDMKGAITLVTGSPEDIGEPRCIHLKPPSSDFFLGTSGISSVDKRFLFSCNQHEKFIEQYDIQRVQCMQRFGSSEYLSYPRCISHSLTSNLLFVSDVRGGVKAFGSNTGRHVTDIGSNFLLTPTGVATDFNWRLYVADELQSLIYVFDTRHLTENSPLYEINTSVKGVAVNCHGISVGRNGNILISVTERSSSYDAFSLLLELNEEGKMLRTGGRDLRKPRGVRVHGKATTVADAETNCIVTYHI